MIRGIKIELARDIHIEQLFPAGVAQHAHEGFVDFDEATVGRGEVETFLDIVEEFPVAPFGLATVGDVFQNVDGFATFGLARVQTGGRNKIGAFEHNLGKFIGVGTLATKRAGIRMHVGGEGKQVTHVDADQLIGLHADETCQRAVDAEDVAGLLVYDDEVTNGVEDFHPVAVGLLNALKNLGIL